MFTLIVLAHIVSIFPSQLSMVSAHSICTECDVLEDTIPSHARKLDPESLNDLVSTYLEVTSGMTASNANGEKITILFTNEQYYANANTVL